MKIRYKNKLYNTDKLNLIEEEFFQHGYYFRRGVFKALDGELIEFKQTNFTNFDNIAYLVKWDDQEREFGSIELKSGVVKIEKNIAIPN